MKTAAGWAALVAVACAARLAPATAAPPHPASSAGGAARFEARWTAPDGRVQALYRPRHVAAPTLLTDAKALLPDGLAPLELHLDAARRRLLVTGAGDRLDLAGEALGYLDVPTPQALVEVALVETLSRRSRQAGGHAAFDRAGGDAPDTFFRSFRAAFEPVAWLRSELVGGKPFEGVSARGGGRDLSGGLVGTLDAVLRGLAHDGLAEIVARPCLVCSEGAPARMSSTVTLPAMLFVNDRFPGGYVVNRRRVDERAGVTLEVLAERVGRDAVRLKVKPWLRRIEEASATSEVPSYPVLVGREAETTLDLPDGATALVAGIEGRRLLRNRRGFPALDHLPAVDGLLSARATEETSTDLHVFVTVRVLRHGREAPPFLPPSELARLAARARSPNEGGAP